jgi:hypothetical protein
MRPLLLALAGLMLAAPARLQTSQNPLEVLVDWGDGPLQDGVGPADASENPALLRFWMGHGLRRGHINIETRERVFDEELVPQGGGTYPSSILELEFDEGGDGQADDRLFVLSRLETNSTPITKARIQMLRVLDPTSPIEIVAPFVEEVPAPGQPVQYDYDITALELVPEDKLLLAVGRALPKQGTTGLTNQLLLILYRYGSLTPGGPKELIKLGELRTDPLPVREIDAGQPRKLWRLLDAEVTKVGSQLLAFARGPMGETSKFTPWGLAAAKLNPNAVAPAPVIEWIPQGLSPGDPVHIFDPHYDVKVGFQSTCGGAIPGPTSPENEQLAGTRISVNHIDFAKVTTGPAPGHYLYAACNRFNQLLEFKIDDLLTAGFGVQKKLDLAVPAPNVGSQSEPFSDNLFWVTVRYVPDYSPQKSVDLLYVVGQQYQHVVSRRPPTMTTTCGPAGPVVIGSPSRAALQQFFGTAPAATGRVMKELADIDGLGSGDFKAREHFWVLAPETPWPWSVFDMTDRDQHPSVEEPGVLDRRYGPGGTDGAVADVASQSIYTTNFGGLIRYSLFTPGVPPMNISPVYDSYSPARVVVGGNAFNFATEQLDLADWTLPGATERDVRVYAATGLGRAVEWRINPATARPYQAELNPSLVGLVPPLKPQAGVNLSFDLELNWLAGLTGCNQLGALGPGYSLCVATGRGVETGRPYVLLDLAFEQGACVFPGAPGPEDLLLLGRYWLPWQGQPGEFQVLHLTQDGDPRRDPLHQMAFDINDIEISPDGAFALVAASGGVFVVALNYSEAPVPTGSSPEDQFARDKAWMVASTRYTEPHTGQGVDPALALPFAPLASTNSYPEVEGAAWLGTEQVVLSMAGPGDQAALALYAFGYHSKALGVVRTLLEEKKQGPVLNGIPGVDYFVGGAVESFALAGGGHRVYATSNGNGVVVELEVQPAPQPILTQLSTYPNPTQPPPTHFYETPDCRPYLWPGLGPLPVILVPRFQQTLLVLRAR